MLFTKQVRWKILYTKRRYAIFLARRLQSFAEVTGKNIAIVLLD